MSRPIAIIEPNTADSIAVRITDGAQSSGPEFIVYQDRIIVHAAGRLIEVRV